MLFYTAIVAISLLIAVPIIILIYQTNSLTNKENSNFGFDERIAAAGSTPGQKYRVKPVILDNAKSTVRFKQLTVRPIREETPASNDKSFKIVAKEVPKAVTLEFARKPLSQKVSAMCSLNSEAVKIPSREG